MQPLRLLPAIKPPVPPERYDLPGDWALYAVSVRLPCMFNPGYKFSKVPICRGGDCGVIDRACLEQAARRTARVVTPYSPLARTVARASTTEPAFYKAGKEEFLQCPTPQSLL